MCVFIRYFQKSVQAGAECGGPVFGEVWDGRFSDKSDSVGTEIITVRWHQKNSPPPVVKGPGGF